MTKFNGMTTKFNFPALTASSLSLLFIVNFSTSTKTRLIPYRRYEYDSPINCNGRSCEAGTQVKCIGILRVRQFYYKLNLKGVGMKSSCSYLLVNKRLRNEEYK